MADANVGIKGRGWRILTGGRENRPIISLGVFSFLLTCGSAWTLQSAGTPVAWPVVGLFTGWLLVNRQANGIAAALTCWLAGSLALVLLAWGLTAAIAMMGLSVCEAFCAVSLLNRRRRNNDEWFHSAEGFVEFIGIIAILSVVFALPATAIASPVAFSTPLHFWFGWSIASFLGSLLIAPTVRLFNFRNLKQAWLRAEKLGVTSLGVLVVILGTLGTFAQSTLPLLFIPVAFIVMTAIKSGRTGALLAIVAFSCVAIIATEAGHGPIASMTPTIFVRHLLLQVYIIVTLVIVTPVTLELRGAKLNAARLMQVLEATSDCVYSLNQDWQFTYLNRKAEAEIGGNGCLLGLHVLDAFPQLEQTPLWPAYQDVIWKGKSRDIECFVPKLDHWYDVHIVPTDAGITVFFRNIDERKAAEVESRDREERLIRTLAHVPQMIWCTRPNGLHDYYSPLWYEFTGVPYGSTYGQGWNEVFHPDDQERARSAWQHSLQTGESYEIQYRLRHHSGEYRWVLGRANPERDERGEIVRWYGTCTDIHDGINALHAWDETRTLQESILDASADCIKLIDSDGTVTFMNNPGLRAMEVGSLDSVRGKAWMSLWPPEAQSAVQEAIQVALSGRNARFSGFCPTGSGTPKWWDVVVSPVRSTNGKIDRLVSISRDITEQRETAQQLKRASEEDPLTNLPNRRAFTKRLQAATIRAMRSGGQVAVLLVDLDHFKHINDTLGHPGGDHVLSVFGKRLQASIRPDDFAARLGGDEFAVILEAPSGKINIHQIGNDIVNRLRCPIPFEGQSINAGASIGGAIFPDNANNAHELLKCADVALYSLKDGGRGGTLMFESSMLEHANAVASQLSLARMSLSDTSIEPYYQPKFDLETGEIKGFEALLRWHHGTRGLQLPDSILEAFKDYELASKIGEVMQNKVFRDMRRWLDRSLSVGPVAINAAPAEFLRNDFAEKFLRRMHEYSVPPSLVEVEVTEHVFLQRGADYVGRALEKLSSAGVKIALDDFGTGHSSLSHLRDYPVDLLKIDRSFVDRMGTDDEVRSIISAVISLATSLKVGVVAEGIETDNQKEHLLQEGCRIGQGFLFGKAIRANEVDHCVQNGPKQLAA